MRRLLAIGMGLLAMTCCWARTTLPQVDPRNWSQGGWQTLRWGMGLGDVELELRKADEELLPLRLSHLPVRTGVSLKDFTGWVVLEGKLRLGGKDCEVHLNFLSGELYSVDVYAEFPGLASGRLAPDVERQGVNRLEAWRDSQALLLRQRYGSPVSTFDRPGDWWRLAWNVEPGTRVEIERFDGVLAEGVERSVIIRYTDKVREERAHRK